LNNFIIFIKNNIYKYFKAYNLSKYFRNIHYSLVVVFAEFCLYKYNGLIRNYIVMPTDWSCRHHHSNRAWYIIFQCFDL